MSRLPLVEGIINYVKEQNSLFCMPGHKGGRGFLKDKKGKELYKMFIKGDITEVDGVDNFHHPTGIIKEAQELLTKLYGSKKSYFLVNGSTSGNLTMIFSTLKEGDKVIVERNCHKSILNGIILRKLKPIYIKNKVSDKFNTPLSIDEEYFLRVLNENEDVKAVIVTYPNYYGFCMNLEFVLREAHKRNIKVLVDSAHGAHFGINEKLPKSAVNIGADMVVTSSHKTLPSLTQTAYLHVNNESLIEKSDFYLSIFTSTSPSYILMCSMDYARYYLEKYGNEDYCNLVNLCEKYKVMINSIEGFHIVDKKDMGNEIYDMDESRYIINTTLCSGHELLDYLKQSKIQCEMSDISNVVLIFSPFNTEEEFNNLYEVLIKIKELKKKSNTYIAQNNIKEQYQIPKSVLLPYEVVERKKESVLLKDALGRICAESVVPYPPGVPILMPGEKISMDIVNLIEEYIKSNITILGLKENKILVVK